MDTNNSYDQEIAAMQEEVRRKQKFQAMEAALPNPRSLTSLALHPKSLFKYLRHALGWPSQLSPEDTVWLFDNTAFRDPATGKWKAEFVGTVLTRDADCDRKVTGVVGAIARLVGLAPNDAAQHTIEQRILPFLYDTAPGRKLTVCVGLSGSGTTVAGPSQLELGHTGINGIASTVLEIPDPDNKFKGGDRVPTSVIGVPQGVEGLYSANVVFAEPEGWAVLSDVDDTIKVSLTSDPIGIVRSTFVEEPVAVTGMPQLYARLRQMLPVDSPFFYLTASPYNLYPFLQGFRNAAPYPPGTIILRDAAWKTVSGLLSNLTLGTRMYKVDRLAKLHSWLPRRRIIMIGDSTQSDPEAYADAYRRFPGWIQLILIRRVTDIAAIGIEDKNAPGRFEKAFKGINREQWHVFDNPEECLPLFEKAIMTNR